MPQGIEKGIPEWEIFMERQGPWNTHYGTCPLDCSGLLIKSSHEAHIAFLK